MKKRIEICGALAPIPHEKCNHYLLQIHTNKNENWAKVSISYSHALEKPHLLGYCACTKLKNEDLKSRNKKEEKLEW